MLANCKDEKGELERTKRRIGEDRKTKRQNLMGERPRTERQKDKNYWEKGQGQEDDMERRGRKYEEDRKAERIWFFDAAPLNYLYKADLMMHLA